MSHFEKGGTAALDFDPVRIAKQIRIGNQAAEQQFVNRYYPVIKRIAARKARGTTLDSDDLAQEGILGVLLFLRGKFDEQRSQKVDSLITTKAIQSIIDHLRRRGATTVVAFPRHACQSKAPILSLDQPENANFPASLPDLPNGATEIIQNDLREMIRSMLMNGQDSAVKKQLMRLIPGDRRDRDWEIFVTYATQNYSYQELAVKYQLSLSNIGRIIKGIRIKFASQQKNIRHLLQGITG